jgi:hypothetical protein
MIGDIGPCRRINRAGVLPLLSNTLSQATFYAYFPAARSRAQASKPQENQEKAQP